MFAGISVWSLGETIAAFDLEFFQLSNNLLIHFTLTLSEELKKEVVLFTKTNTEV